MVEVRAPLQALAIQFETRFRQCRFICELGDDDTEQARRLAAGSAAVQASCKTGLGYACLVMVGLAQ